MSSLPKNILFPRAGAYKEMTGHDDHQFDDDDDDDVDGDDDDGKGDEGGTEMNR